MKQIPVKPGVSEATERIKKLLIDRGFTLFNDINHQENAECVGMTLPESRVLIFGNPVAGTQLMQENILASFDLPLRVAVVNKDNKTYLVHQKTDSYSENYQLDSHPVLDKFENLFAAITTELNK